MEFIYNFPYYYSSTTTHEVDVKVKGADSLAPIVTDAIQYEKERSGPDYNLSVEFVDSKDQLRNKKKVRFAENSDLRQEPLDEPLDELL